jgi:hypothetical protein
MSPAEVGWRLADAGRRKTWTRRQVPSGERGPMPEDVRQVREFTSLLPMTARDAVPPGVALALIDAADRILAGEWTVMGANRPDSADPDWFLDPLSGIRAPSDVLGFRINHRDEHITGNIKQVWEMSRHHHLTVLAAAWWLTEDEKYAQNVAAQLRSWWAANPFLTGVHWTSGIEAGVRLISWVWIRRLLDSWPKAGDLFENDDDAVRQIRWHQEFLAAFPSRGSSANNHVLAEAAGSLAAACAFDWYGRSAQWRREAAALLERELDSNTYESGLNRELATDYHRFVIELALTAGVEADAAGHPLSDQTWSTIGRMLDAGAAILDRAGRPPRQGDGDEGRGLVVDDPELDGWAVALGSGAALLGTPRWWPDFTPSVQSVVIGATGIRRSVPRLEQRPSAFTDAGCVILRSRPEDGEEIWCRFDTGPHGFLSIAAHAHADALSIELRHGGVEILSDPGTYCYHGQPAWREWFRSTSAHNTVKIGGVDQSESGGPFMWTTHANAVDLIRGGTAGPVRCWGAQHDGYQRLSTPVTHRRYVGVDSHDRSVTIVDRLLAKNADRSSSELPVSMTWQFGPDISVDLDDHQATLSWIADGREQQARVLLPPMLEWTLHCGETEPIAGWYSPGFAQRVPAPSLIGAGSARRGSTLATTFELP